MTETVMRAEIVNLCETGEPGQIAVWVNDNDSAPYYLTKWEDGGDPLWAQGLAYIAEHDPTVAQQLPAAQARIAELEARCEQLIADNAQTQAEFGGRIAKMEKEIHAGLLLEASLKDQLLLCQEQADRDKRIAAKCSERLRLALDLLLADHGGIEDVLDVLENDIAEIQATGGDVTALNALVAALVDVRRHNDLRREEAPDGDDAR